MGGISAVAPVSPQADFTEKNKKKLDEVLPHEDWEGRVREHPGG